MQQTQAASELLNDFVCEYDQQMDSHAQLQATVVRRNVTKRIKTFALTQTTITTIIQKAVLSMMIMSIYS